MTASKSCQEFESFSNLYRTGDWAEECFFQLHKPKHDVRLFADFILFELYHDGSIKHFMYKKIM